MNRHEDSALDKKEVMTEDSLKDLDNLYTDMKTDNVGAGYLRMAQSVSFYELCAYII